MGAHVPRAAMVFCKHRVRGLIPLVSTSFNAGIAQLIEHLVAIQKVVSLSLITRSSYDGPFDFW